MCVLGTAPLDYEGFAEDSFAEAARSSCSNAWDEPAQYQQFHFFERRAAPSLHRLASTVHCAAASAKLSCGAAPYPPPSSPASHPPRCRMNRWRPRPPVASVRCPRTGANERARIRLVGPHESARGGPRPNSFKSRN